ncbi:MAG TPA: discoidin domain-containing protein [Thermoanaerobaculia bacterium]
MFAAPRPATGSPQLVPRHPAVIIDAARPLHSFNASTAFGATVDAHPRGETPQAFTKENIEEMLSIGFGPVSYRLVTELACEAWHWNPRGTWSDPQHQQGYWTSSSDLGAPIALSYGYRLPRRGNTIDQAANDGYSRIDDGDPSTFWKSNPYLGEAFAGEPHPQWIVVDFGRVERVNALRIDWGNPYATSYRVQWWNGEDAIGSPAEGDWIDFEDGRDDEGVGGVETRRLSARSVEARWIRILMLDSSKTTGGASEDVRDSIGFAVRELSAGMIDDRGFHDLVRHGTTRAAQTVIWVSSTDPWHRATDIDEDDEQLGFDALFATGLTRGRPLLTPVALSYGIPDDAAAEVRYLRARGYPVSQIEMGEEPDGQNASPEDYAAFYRQYARAIHRVDPSLRLGGPAFQSTANFVSFWRDGHAGTAWVTRFLADLRAHDQLADFSFFSFEWYPFDDLCRPPQPQIERQPALLASVLARWRREGVPESIPWIATEYGYSSYTGQAEVELYAAIVDADFIGQFLSEGGSAAYFYTYEPDVLLRELRCPTWGNLTPFLSDEQHRVRYKLPAYWAAWMITHEWSARSGEQQMYRAHVRDARNIGAYVLRRPDGRWSVMLTNRSATASPPLSIVFGDGRTLSGEVRVTEYSPAQYEWRADGENGRPVRDLPPVTRVMNPIRRITLPPHSITVVTE